MAAHSKIGASSAKRWMTCPGSVKLSEGIEQKNSDFSAEGTCAHALAEDMLRSKGDPETYVGMTFWYDDHGEEKTEVITQEMADNVKIYVDHVISLGGKLHIEQRFHLKDLHEDLFGTADAVVWDEATKTLYVVDLKYGAGLAVEVNDNPQLMYYAVGALLQLGYRAENVVMTIVQPRCPHPDGPVRVREISALDLLDWSADLVDAVKMTEYAATEYNNISFFPSNKEWAEMYLSPGDHCRWCLAAPNCPSLQSMAQNVSKIEFSPVLSYDPAKLADTLRWLPILEGYIKSVREFAYGEAEHGRVPPGFKLVQKRATRKWASEARAVEFLKSYKLLDDEMYDFKLKSIASLEKSVFAKGAIPEEYITKESSGYTLAPEEDNRPAARISASDDFADVLN